MACGLKPTYRFRDYSKFLMLFGLTSMVTFSVPVIMQFSDAKAGWFSGTSSPAPIGFAPWSGGFTITDRTTGKECSECHIL